MMNSWIRFLEWVERKPIAFSCVAVTSFIWLAAVVPFLSLYHDGVQPFFSPVNKGSQDFAQYYMGGAVVLEGAADAMYPDAKPDIRANVGWPENSVPKPEYAAIALERGVEDSFRYMLPPPTALLLTPLALLPYPLARGIWVVLLGASCWGVCLLSYRMSRRVGGSRFTGLLWWGVWSFSPLMLKAIRTANSTPFVALGLGVAAWGLFYKRTSAAVSGCVVSGLLKGTSLIFLPFILLMNRWRVIVGGLVAAIVLNLITIWIAGVGVYQEFFSEIYPTTRILDPYSGNQSVFGFLYRSFGEGVFNTSLVGGVKVAGRLLMGVLILRLWKTRALWACDYSRFSSAVLGLLGVYLIFSAYCWDHYILLYLSFWTVLWNCSRNRLVRVVLSVSAALVWCPLIVFHGKQIAQCEPFQSHMLWGQFLLLVVVMCDLFRKPTALVERK